METITLHNNQTVPSGDIPLLEYERFLQTNCGLLDHHPERHCVNYFGLRKGNGILLFCCIADDETHEIFVSSAFAEGNKEFPALTGINHQFDQFEREIHENFGLRYTGHPWLKPYRFSFNRAGDEMKVGAYPFYQVKSDELHEVAVGPIHAGIIEPGHFRFICNGEQIMHLEIQLGYQHRGIEELFLRKTGILERATLAENIAGDTTVGHTTAFSNLWESLCGFPPDPRLQFTRTLALELERIAIHTGDLAAICGDIAYQLGNAVYGRLRTPIINFFQEWEGNRLAKGLIRPGKFNFPFTHELAERLLRIFSEYEPEFHEMSELLFTLPSALSRMERTGTVTLDQALETGAVGMAARSSGLQRDIRCSHPHDLYGGNLIHEPVIKTRGDVFSRVQLRREEIAQSIGYCKALLSGIPEFAEPVDAGLVPARGKFGISLTEGWRGEICHCAITDEEGNLLLYKIKDPSHHNWMALALAVRNNEISDFPVCNKSFNLSYCGHDL